MMKLTGSIYLFDENNKQITWIKTQEDALRLGLPVDNHCAFGEVGDELQYYDKRYEIVKIHFKVWNWKSLLPENYNLNSEYDQVLDLIITLKEL